MAERRRTELAPTLYFAISARQLYRVLRQLAGPGVARVAFTGLRAAGRANAAGLQFHRLVDYVSVTRGAQVLALVGLPVQVLPPWLPEPEPPQK